ncbi:MAG: LysR family transcriptional regulator [Polyangiales bacterium]
MEELDLSSLRTFLVVFELRSISAAARRARLSTNAVSQRIARLEAQLEAQLFVRTTRVVRPTPLAEDVAPRARVLLAQSDELVAVAASGGRGARAEVVRVGLAPDLTRVFDWEPLRALLAQRAGLRVELLSRAREADIVAAGLDLAVWVGPLPPRELVVRKIGTVEWHLAAAPSYVRDRGAPSTPAELAQHDALLAIAAKREASWPLIDEEGRECDAPVSSRFESDSGEVLYSALYGGMGIGIRPAAEVERAVREGRLVRILPRFRLRPMPVALLAPAARMRSPAVRLVADFLRAMIEPQRARRTTGPKRPKRRGA